MLLLFRLVISVLQVRRRKMEELVDDPLRDELQEFLILGAEPVDVLLDLLMPHLFKVSAEILDRGAYLE